MRITARRTVSSVLAGGMLWAAIGVTAPHSLSQSQSAPASAAASASSAASSSCPNTSFPGGPHCDSSELSAVHRDCGAFRSGFRLARLYESHGQWIRKLVNAETAHRIAVNALSWNEWTRKMCGIIEYTDDNKAQQPSPLECHSASPTKPTSSSSSSSSSPAPSLSPSTSSTSSTSSQAESASISHAELLRTRVWQLQFSSPLGIAAGFDKNGECVAGLWDCGFSVVEVGSITPKPQPGNPKPRVFRLEDDAAIINRYGFNSDGAQAVQQRVSLLSSRRGGLGRVLGINLGKNKQSTDAVDDYVQGVHAFYGLADYLVINISSPNTPGLRDLQARAELKQLVTAVINARNAQHAKRNAGNEGTTRRGPVPILVKIAPDLSAADCADIAAVALDCKVDGLIVSNTTLNRPQSLKSSQRLTSQAGGLSGAPLFDVSTELLAEMYRRTGGQIPLIGVGGVRSGADAYAKIRAGASLVQLYSAFAYDGPMVAHRIKQDLAELLRRDGFHHVSQAVGVDARIHKPMPPQNSDTSLRLSSS